MFKLKNHFKNNWFQYILALVCIGVFKIMAGFGGQIHAKKCQIEIDRPYCYIFYGIAQNKVSKNGGRLSVNHLVEGFPKRPHSVFVELKDHNDELDFLYSEIHAKSHQAHLCKDGCQRVYKSSYKIPQLKPGKYKLRVTFKFSYLLGTKDLVSNDIIFEVE